MIVMNNNQAARSKQAQMDQWYRDYGKLVSYYIQSRVGSNPDLLADLRQTTFDKAWRDFSLRERSDPIERPDRWLIKIADNVCNTFFTQSRAQASHELVYIGSQAASQEENHPVLAKLLSNERDQPERRAERQEQEDWLHEHLKLLSPEVRQVVDLHYLQGYSYQQIADRLDRGKSTVERDAQRGVQELKRLYREYEGIESNERKRQ